MLGRSLDAPAPHPLPPARAFCWARREWPHQEGAIALAIYDALWVRGIDLGIIGTTLAAQGCDGGDATLPSSRQPQPLRADSRDPNSSQLKQENEKYVSAITKAVRADAPPFAEAQTDTAGISAAGSIVRLDGVVSKATTRLANGSREAIATSEDW